jgi:hypothetical protein
MIILQEGRFGIATDRAARLRYYDNFSFQRVLVSFSENIRALWAVWRAYRAEGLRSFLLRTAIERSKWMAENRSSERQQSPKREPSMGDRNIVEREESPELRDWDADDGSGAGNPNPARGNLPGGNAVGPVKAPITKDRADQTESSGSRSN